MVNQSAARGRWSVGYIPLGSGFGAKSAGNTFTANATFFITATEVKGSLQVNNFRTHFVTVVEQVQKAITRTPYTFFIKAVELSQKSFNLARTAFIPSSVPVFGTPTNIWYLDNPSGHSLSGQSVSNSSGTMPTVADAPVGSLVCCFFGPWNNNAITTAFTDTSNNVWNIINCPPSAQANVEGETIAWTQVTNDMPIGTLFAATDSAAGGYFFTNAFKVAVPPGYKVSLDTSNTFATNVAGTSTTLLTGTLASPIELVIGYYNQGGLGDGGWTEGVGFTTFDAEPPPRNPANSYAVSYQQIVGNTSSVTWAPSWVNSVPFDSMLISFKATGTLLDYIQKTVNTFRTAPITVTEQVQKQVNSSRTAFVIVKDQIQKTVNQFRTTFITVTEQTQKTVNKAYTVFGTVKEQIQKMVNQFRTIPVIVVEQVQKTVNKTYTTFTTVKEQIQKTVNQFRTAFVNVIHLYTAVSTHTYNVAATFFINVKEQSQKQVNTFRTVFVTVASQVQKQVGKSYVTYIGFKELIQKQVNQFRTGFITVTEQVQKQVGVTRIFKAGIVMTFVTGQAHLYSAIFFVNTTHLIQKTVNQFRTTFITFTTQIQKAVTKIPYNFYVIITEQVQKTVNLSRLVKSTIILNYITGQAHLYSAIFFVTTKSLVQKTIDPIRTAYAGCKTLLQRQAGSVRVFPVTVTEAIQKAITKSAIISKITVTVLSLASKAFLRTFTFVSTAIAQSQKQVDPIRTAFATATEKFTRAISMSRIAYVNVAFPTVQKAITHGAIQFFVTCTGTAQKQVNKLVGIAKIAASFLATATKQTQRVVNVAATFVITTITDISKNIPKSPVVVVFVENQIQKTIPKLFTMPIVANSPGFFKFLIANYQQLHGSAAVPTLAVRGSINTRPRGPIGAPGNITTNDLEGATGLPTRTQGPHGMPGTISRISINRVEDDES